MKNIERSNDKILGGVCAGLARHFDIKPIYLRLLAVLAFFFTGGTAILVYIVCWIIIPKEQKSIGFEVHENAATREELKGGHTTYSKQTTSPVKRLFIIGLFGLIGCVGGGAIGFYMVGSSAGNVLIPMLGIIGLILGGVLGIIVAVTR